MKIVQYSLALNLVAWSPDGSKIATNVIGVNMQIWDAQGNHLNDLGESTQDSLNWGSDSKTILADIPNVINTNDDTSSISFQVCGNITATAWSHDGKIIAVGGIGGAVGDMCFVDASTGMITYDLAADPNSVEIQPLNSMAFSPDDKQLAGVTNAGRVLIWDPKTLKLLYDWPAPESPTANIASAAISKLQFTPLCSPNPAQYRMWKAVNVNPFDVVFQWSVVNSPQKQSGNEIVPAAQNGKPGERIFQISTELGDNALYIQSPPQRDTIFSTTAQCPTSTLVATATSP